MIDYASFEVTPVPAPPEPTVWDQVEWFDGECTLLGFDYGPAPTRGAVGEESR